MPRTRRLTLLLLTLDFVSIVVAFNLVRLMSGLASPMGNFLIWPLLIPTIFVFFGLYLIDGYKPRTDMMSLEYASLHSIAIFTAMLATLLTTFVVIPHGYSLQSSRIVILLGFLTVTFLTLSYRRTVHARFARKLGKRSLVFLGDAESCLAFQEECRTVGMTEPVIFSTITPMPERPLPEATPPLREFPLVLEQLQRGELRIEAIILRESNRELQPELAQRLVRLYFAGVPTYTLELFHQVYWRKIPLYRLNQTWLFQEGFPIAREPVFERLKRASDVFLAALGLLLASPLILLAGVAVWLEDRGPFFFFQPRIGKNRRQFYLVKLRTMRPSDGNGNPYTQPGDARITRVGAFLRATRIDEFPQLWNVLRGDMSLIGPRAEWSRLVEDYEAQIPCYHFRHLVKPGITGWAQVNYPYGANIEDTLRKLEYDLYYIRYFSFLLDASIVLKTIHVMLFGKGR